jgi:hypothetical protein
MYTHPQVPQRGPWWERCSVSRANGLLIICQSPQLRSCPKKWGGKHMVPSTEPHMDGRPTYNVLWPGSPRGSFMTLLSLLQWNAAFSMIPSTLACVEQSRVSQCVSCNPQQKYPLNGCYCLPCNPEMQTRGWIYGSHTLSYKTHWF